jgi:uncharacterized membrane protein
MKKLMILFYVFKWIALILLTFLTVNEIHSENRKIIIFLLVIFIAAGLVVEGRREFKTSNRKTTNL